MPAKTKVKPAVETRSFQEIVASRMPQTPTVRERLASAAEARKATRVKLAEQEPALKDFRAKIAKKHKPGTAEYDNALAQAHRELKASA